MDASKKNLNLLVIAITVLVVAALAWVYIGRWEANRAPGSSASPTAVNTIQDLPNTILPPGISKNIVLAKDAQVLHSYAAITPQGKQQSTLIYLTQESPGALLQQYDQYLLRNGWLVAQSNISSTAAYATTASKASSTITVATFENTNPSGLLVSITIIGG